MKYNINKSLLWPNLTSWSWCIHTTACFSDVYIYMGKELYLLLSVKSSINLNSTSLLFIYVYFWKFFWFFYTQIVIISKHVLLNDFNRCVWRTLLPIPSMTWSSFPWNVWEESWRLDNLGWVISASNLLFEINVSSAYASYQYTHPSKTLINDGRYDSYCWYICK